MVPKGPTRMLSGRATLGLPAGSDNLRSGRQRGVQMSPLTDDQLCARGLSNLFALVTEDH